MWFEFMDKFRRREISPSPAETLLVGTRRVTLLMVRNPRARRYLLRLRPDGTPCVTIPRGGSAAAAREFVERNRPWLERQWQAMASRPRTSSELRTGSTILFRGDTVPIESTETGQIRVGNETLLDPGGNLRPAIERHFRQLAARELPARLLELANQHGFSVSRITVRAQRSRWGSCSRRATVSLNWRLIQTPPHVRDYIILHELAHLRQMNHSSRFWAEVERLCPDYLAAERWLKEHRDLLRAG